MTLPAKVSSGAPDGVLRSAALMRALGAKANAVWSALSPSEARHLTQAMETLDDNPVSEVKAAQAYLRDVAETPRDAMGQAPSVWQRLARQDTAVTARFLAEERPAVIAVILSKLPEKTAAELVRDLPSEIATPALRHLLHLGPVHPRALQAIETTVEKALTAAPASPAAGTERIARIFDNLETRVEQGLLAALDGAEPGLGERIRALMFTFDDIAHLDPASLQTILASIDRSVLALALKGAREETANAFLNNMTQRARDLMKSEIEMLGPVRRADIEAARAELTGHARTLVKRGDILIHPDDEELVE
ncbi:MAG: FliG C-terminal domain-containing protein [Henriciella sp.]|nr:FliG C-terminal domain-containing protein [Henriciella sp.]